MRKVYTFLLLAFFASSIVQSAPVTLLNFTDTEISIYPNPVKNFATIEFSAGVDRIVIMNIVGKEVMTLTPDSDTQQIKVNLTDLQPGVYFIAAYNNGVKLITKRFMKEQ
ncbi:MAG: T9SS type A sorting domain-containing protein [Chitinophagales bacterium]